LSLFDNAMSSQNRGLGLVGAFVVASHLAVPAPQERVWLVGQVTDRGTAAPIPGALVTLASSTASSRIRQVVAADGDGRFVFRDLPDGSYLLQGRATGFIPGGFGAAYPGAEVVPIAVGARGGDRVKRADVRLWKAAAIGGRVFTEDDRPAPSVTVRAIAVDGPATSARPPAYAVTAEDGRFSVTDLLPGDYVVGITITATTLNEQQVAAMRPIGSMVAWLMPVGDVWVRYYSTTDTIHSWFEDQTLFVRPTVFYPSTAIDQGQVISVAAGDRVQAVDLYWKAEQSIEVTGSVLAESGEVNDVFVSAYPLNANALTITRSLLDSAETRTNAAGRFHLVGLVPGRYRISASRIPPRPPGAPPGPLLAWASASIALEAGKSANLSLGLRPGLRVRGRLQAAPGTILTDRLISNLSVSLAPVGQPSETTAGASLRVSGGGTFDLGPLLPGRYLFGAPLLRGWTIESINYRGQDIDGAVMELTDADLDDLLVVLSDHQSSVKVDASRREDTDPAQLVLLFPDDRARWLNAASDRRRFQQGTLAATGICQFNDVPPGMYLIVSKSYSAISPNWRKPNALDRLAAEATRVVVTRGQTTAVTTPKREP
jgi:hypothetical protein